MKKLLFLAAMLAGSTHLAIAETSKPNVVFILADDLAVETLALKAASSMKRQIWIALQKKASGL